ncbi:MAG: hypothetical protein IKO25_07165 [Clostridia bacterium]|nr:hypothetical protein [Clostridia bacterium]
MGKLIRMDLYRMLKCKSFPVCLTIAFVLALVNAPVAKLMYSLANSLSSEIKETIPAEVNLSAVLSDPFPMIGLMLALLSLCFFFYADVENGYIKNIAGQMPMKGFTVLSKFTASAVHNLCFAMAGIIGNLIGTVLVQRIVMDAGVADSIRVLVLKLLLVQGLCAMLVLVVSTLRSKSLGMILAVLFGLGLTSLIYMGINEGLKPIFGQNTDISSIMPDTVMNEKPLDTLKALAVAVVTGIIFLLPAIRILDKKDVK